MSRPAAVVAASLVVALLGSVPAAASEPAGSSVTASEDVQRGAAAAVPTTAEARAWVTAVYGDLLGRAPEPAGLDHWVAMLQAGTPYSDVAWAITTSREFRQRIVTDIYATLLERPVDPSGLATWVGELERGVTPLRIRQSVAISPEMWARGGGSLEGWLTVLYRTALGREAGPADIGYWTNRLATSSWGNTPEYAAGGVLDSTEFYDRLVDGWYRTLLDRPLEESAKLGWWTGLQGELREEAMIAFIASSPEYRSHL